MTCQVRWLLAQVPLYCHIRTCLGDYREAHCHKCGEHYYAGGAGDDLECEDCRLLRCEEEGEGEEGEVEEEGCGYNGRHCHKCGGQVYVDALGLHCYTCFSDSDEDDL